MIRFIFELKRNYDLFLFVLPINLLTYSSLLLSLTNLYNAILIKVIKLEINPANLAVTYNWNTSVKTNISKMAVLNWICMHEDLLVVHILYLTLQLFPQFAINQRQEWFKKVSNLVYDSKVNKRIYLNYNQNTDICSFTFDIKVFIKIPNRFQTCFL